MSDKLNNGMLGFKLIRRSHHDRHPLHLYHKANLNYFHQIHRYSLEQSSNNND